ncbi:hypothetical protein F4813DRAFT_362584 [Daldinia decipiens]|uniref:uncharacterized protein n=1 Tax=Daldinia decipiens TaxID=326647 RepID=UPI0020C4CFD5|nr:uncharacterized protein F4813DRAFT_362584 [Daldinia decipiens]KAI1656993.1 hypothetical protein F4813DRAFT_362584 [Daldinia decipiens]
MGSIISSTPHSTTSSGQDNLRTCAVLIGLTSIVVLLRIWVRVSQRQCLKGHDWLCIVSLILYCAQCGLIIDFIVRHGAFETGPPLEPPEVIELLKMAWICEFLFSGIITTVKLSILWFYYSLFSVNKTSKRATITTAVLCIIWFIVAIFIITFQCDPIDAFWTQFNSQEYCLNATDFLLGYETTNLLLDVVIICIPFGILGKLQLSMTRRISLLVIFILGGLVCIASIVRLTAIYPLPDPTKNFDFSVLILWGEIQSGVAILCACLPTLGPLFSDDSKAIRAVRNWHGLSAANSTRTRGVSGNQSRGPHPNTPVHGWPEVEDPQASRSWIRVDESISDTFPLKPVKHYNHSSTGRDPELQ